MTCECHLQGGVLKLTLHIEKLWYTSFLSVTLYLQQEVHSTDLCEGYISLLNARSFSCKKTVDLL